MKRRKQAANFAILSILILACQVSGMIATPTSLPPTVTIPASTATITFTPNSNSQPHSHGFPCPSGLPSHFHSGRIRYVSLARV